MAFRDFETKVKAVSGGSYVANAFRSVGSRQLVTYDMKANDDGLVPLLEPMHMTDLDVMDRALAQYSWKFPRAGESLFEWREDWASDVAAQIRIVPWLRCTSIVAERESMERLMWRARAEYQTDPRFDVDQADLTPIPLTSVTGTANYPFLVETIWGMEEKVVWEDAKVPPNKDKLRLPTGSLYSEPFMRQYSQRTIRQTQFEIPGSTIEALVEARLFTLADAAVFGDPKPIPGDIPPRWKCVDIEYQQVNLPIEQGGNINYLTGAYMIQYKMERSSLPGGWLDRRAIIDMYHNEIPGDPKSKKANREISDGITIIPQLLDDQGTLLVDQSGTPDYIDYQLQPLDDWSIWLR